MAIDTATPRTRRALLAGVVGAVAGFGARALGAPSSALAANGDPLLVGRDNNTSSQYTKLTNGASDALFASSIYGLAANNGNQNGLGVSAYVSGTDATGIRAQTSGHYTQIAVDANTMSGAGEGIAVRARVKNGIAVRAQATQPGGYAIEVLGRAVFERSGKVIFSSGQSSRTISGRSITAASLVVATIQGNVSGTWVRGVSLNDADNKFTIRLNKAAPSSLVVGWFIVN